MEFEDRVRAEFKKAEATLPAGRLDHMDAVARGRHLRTMRAAVIVVSVAVALGGGFFVGGSLRSETGPPRIEPVGPGETASPPPVECAEELECPAPAPNEDKPAGEGEGHAVPGRKRASFVPGGTSDGCSGGLDAHVGFEQRGLPDKVNEVRRDIITRTWTCDYEGLAEIALFDDDPPFRYVNSAEEEARPADRWRNLEESGEPMGAVTRILVRTLETTPTMVDRPGLGAVWVWPGLVVSDRPNDREWEELYDVYERDQVGEMRTHGGNGFYGYQVEIAEDGDWISFVYVP